MMVEDDTRATYGRCRVCGAQWYLLAANADRDAQACRCGAPSGALAVIPDILRGRVGHLVIDPAAPPLPDAEVEQLRARWEERLFLRRMRIDDAILDDYRDAPAGVGLWPPKDADDYRRRAMHAINAWPFVAHRLSHVPSGWMHLIERAAVEIALRGDKADDLRTSEIKEKFGVMRWYLDGTGRAVQDIVDAAEERSAATCACCGAGEDEGTQLRGRESGRVWALTLCDTCHALPDSDLMRRMYPE